MPKKSILHKKYPAWLLPIIILALIAFFVYFFLYVPGVKMVADKAETIAETERRQQDLKKMQAESDEMMQKLRELNNK